MNAQGSGEPNRDDARQRRLGRPRLQMLRRHLAATCLLAGMGIVLLLSMRSESPITDEAFHLTRGLAYFWGPDASLSYAHPPLGNALAALPVALLEPKRAMGRLPGYEQGDVSKVGTALLAPRYGERRHWFALGRTSIALLTLALGAYLYAWTLSLFGMRVALTCLLFFVTQPALVAHGRLVTTDMPITATMVIATCELARYLAGHHPVHGIGAAVFAGLALATKFTGLALLPISVPLVLACAALRVGRYASLSRLVASSKALGFLTLWGLACLLVVNIAYRFESTGMNVQELLERPEPQNSITAPFEGQLLERHSALRHLPAWLPVPLPYTYVLGLASVQVHDSEGHQTMFFGERVTGGHPAYFPVLLAIKTPTVLLLACACALFFFVQRKGKVSLPTLTLACFSLVLLGLAMRGSINIGLRHVLPLLPPLAVFGAQGAVACYDRARAARPRDIAAWLGRGAQLAGMAFYFPDYISDFNMLVGGKTNGERISIVGEDWGQDAIRLGVLAKKRGIRKLHFNGGMFTSKGELALHGVKTTRAPCQAERPAPDGWVAVTARQLGRDDCFGWARTLEPTFEVNGHIFVYGPQEQSEKGDAH